MIWKTIRPVAAFAFYVSISAPAYAYLDPATGSIVLQALIGVAASWIMYSKMFASKVGSLFSRLTKRGQEADSGE